MKMKLTIILLALFFSNGLFSQTQQEKKHNYIQIKNNPEWKSSQNKTIKNDLL